MQTKELIDGKLLRLLTQQPELYDKCVQILYLEKDQQQGHRPLGWEWWEAKLDNTILKRMVLDDILNIEFRSRSSTNYKVKNLDLFKKTLEAYEAITREPAIPETTTIPVDLFDVIVGYDEIKKLLLQSINSPEPTHFLFAGPPSTSKSLFLLELARLPYSRWALGSLTSKHGLTRWVMENRPRFLLIDELDKMDQEDYSSLLSLMETGIMTEMKVGRTEQVKLHTWVFATANRQERLPPELKSRFLIVRFKDYTIDQFAQVVTLVLTHREKTTPELANYIAKQLKTRTRDVRDAIKVARLCATSDEVDKLLETAASYGLFGGEQHNETL